jgi:hypothetical protein
MTVRRGKLKYSATDMLLCKPQIPQELPWVRNWGFEANSIWCAACAVTLSEKRYSQVQILPTNALLLVNIFLCYNIMLHHVSTPVGVIFRDTFKSYHKQNDNTLL